MDEVATMHSYRMILCNTRGRADQELHFLELLRTKQVDGVILASVVNEWETIYPYLQYGPIVLCNEYPRGLHGAPVITIDQKKGDDHHNETFASQRLPFNCILQCV